MWDVETWCQSPTLAAVAAAVGFAALTGAVAAMGAATTLVGTAVSLSAVSAAPLAR